MFMAASEKPNWPETRGPWAARTIGVIDWNIRNPLSTLSPIFHWNGQTSVLQSFKVQGTYSHCLGRSQASQLADNRKRVTQKAGRLQRPNPRNMMPIRIGPVSNSN